MSKNSGIGHVWAANVGEDGRPNGVGPVWIENISAIGGGGGGSIPSEVSGKWEDASNCVESNSAAWGAGSFTGVSASNSLTGNGYDIPLGLNTPVVMQNNESTASYNQYGMSVNDGNGMQTLGIDDIKNWNSAANTVSANSSAWNDCVRKTYGKKQRIDMGGGNYIDLGLSDIANTPGVRINDKTTLGKDYVQIQYQNYIANLDNTVNVFGQEPSIELKNNKNNVSSKLTNIALTFNSGADTASLDLYDISALKSASGGGGAVDMSAYVPFSANNLAFLGTNANYKNSAVGSNAFAHGNLNRASAMSLAQGYGNIAEYKTLAQGASCTAYLTSLAQGQSDYASGYSLAQGDNCYASAHSLAQGTYCTAKSYSISNGSNNFANDYSQAFGRYNHITNSGMVIGTFNETSSNASFVIGNGTANNARSDSFVVYHDGSVSAAGNVSANGHELPIVEYVSNSAAATGTNILYVVTGSN